MDDWEEWGTKMIASLQLLGASMNGSRHGCADDAGLEPQLPGKGLSSGRPRTQGEVLLSAAGEPDPSQFEDEDKDDEGEFKRPEAQEGPGVPQPQAAKKKGSKVKKAAEEKERKDKEQKAAAPSDKPLEDPVAEKLRQQRLQEESDIKAAVDTFSGANKIDIDTFVPKTEEEHEQLADLLNKRYLHSLKVRPGLLGLIFRSFPWLSFPMFRCSLWDGCREARITNRSSSRSSSTCARTSKARICRRLRTTS